MTPDAPDLSPRDILRGASSLATDSRAVQPGGVFVALRGLHTDGHRYISQALERGATTVVMEEATELPDGVRGVIVRDSARALSALASSYYGEPAQQMFMVGVTGTNGKTTTTHMISAVLNAAGKRCAVIGTLGASFENDHRPLANTTPLANELHALLASLRDSGAQAVAMEVSSHALALKRVVDVPYRIGVLTNITRDHLDFHETFDAYVAAKRTLFEVAGHSILNHDDDHGAKWSVQSLTRSTTYSLHGEADIVASGIRLHANGSTFTVGGRTFTLPLPGRFNISNALATIAVARRLDIHDDITAGALAGLPPVPGRMEVVRGAGITVVVDYAHTPDALRNALRTLRETTRGKLLVVFGAGGDRDRGKRPEMGAVAAELADRIIVTSDNPRGEDAAHIAGDIIAGIGSKAYVMILDRREAIHRAVRDASPEDVVLVAGKGHEPYQIIGHQTTPFDDRAVAREALQARDGSGK